jgi:hypothetical protein
MNLARITRMHGLNMMERRLILAALMDHSIGRFPLSNTLKKPLKADRLYL